MARGTRKAQEAENEVKALKEQLAQARVMGQGGRFTDTVGRGIAAMRTFWVAEYGQDEPFPDLEVVFRDIWCPRSWTDDSGEVLQPYGHMEDLVGKIEKVVRFDPKTGLVLQKLYKMPPAWEQDGDNDIFQLEEQGPLPPELSVLLRGVIVVRGEAGGNPDGLPHVAHTRLLRALGVPLNGSKDSDWQGLLARRRCEESVVTEAWSQDTASKPSGKGHKGASGSAISGEGLKACLYGTADHVQVCAVNGMHEGKDTSPTGARERTEDLKRRNVLEPYAPLEVAVQCALEQVLALAPVRGLVDRTLGRKGVSQQLTMQSEDVLVAHVNFYGGGSQGLGHQDFEGSKHRAGARMEPGILANGSLGTAFAAEGGLRAPAIRPGQMGLQWQVRPEKEVHQEIGAGDGPGRVVLTVNLAKYAWVVFGMPGCRIQQDAGPNNETACSWVPERMVKALLGPGDTWAVGAGQPCLVSFGDPQVDPREDLVSEWGFDEASRNIMHGVVDADTLNAPVSVNSDCACTSEYVCQCECRWLRGLLLAGCAVRAWVSRGLLVQDTRAAPNVDRVAIPRRKRPKQERAAFG